MIAGSVAESAEVEKVLVQPVGAPNASVSLQVKGLTKTFGRIPVLNNVDVEVSKGEFVCVLGPSGCGKTTLLRCIAGLAHQDSGRIFHDGREITDLPAPMRDFGFVFQSYALFPNLTVRRNIGYGLRNVSEDVRNAKINDLLRLVDLTPEADKYPASISGGQQQRVALARALARDPSLLLLDEPLSALDAQVRSRLRSELKRLQRTVGVTTLMVTHDQEEALFLSDRIYVMNRGVVEQSGSPLEIYRQPATSFVAGFVGTMNFLHGRAAAGRSIEVGTAISFLNLNDQIASGMAVDICIRPENVIVETLVPGAASFDATVAAIDFLGSTYRLTLTSQRDHSVVLRADVSTETFLTLGLTKGSPVRASIALENMMLYPVTR